MMKSRPTVSPEMLQRIKRVLNAVAHHKTVLPEYLRTEINDVRRDLFALAPIAGRKPMRITDGPSYDEIYAAGYRFGTEAVAANYNLCVDANLDLGAIDLLRVWLGRHWRARMDNVLDGSDPDYDRLAEGFRLGIVEGVREFLRFTREDFDPELAELVVGGT